MSGQLTKKLSGWGRYPVAVCHTLRPERYAELGSNSESSIARGQGRAYGDAALNTERQVVLTERLGRLRSFDAQSGVLRAEAGLTMQQLIDFSLPQGWFPSVTPGTQFVSLGGCVAADVHGKNHHHDGAFSTSVMGFELIDADGGRRWCSREENFDAFAATVGGMGLTGIIGEVELQMRRVESAYIQATHHAADNLHAAFELFEQHYDATYSVAWIDLQARGAAQGRSVVMLGEHAPLERLSAAQQQSPFAIKARANRRVPFEMPGWLLNPLTIGAFNQLYYRIEGRRRTPFIIDYRKFFYPLDALSDWNRLYGRRGFLQYQCVVPRDGAQQALSELLTTLAESRHPAFLGVLKKMGKTGEGLLSFPLEGYTLALDLPFSGDALLQLLQRFDAIVSNAGGRVYLAKDARLDSEMFRAMYPGVEPFIQSKGVLDPDGRFSSDLSRRLELG
ncbi:MAG: FAD-binding oxidoreductase [Chromatiales bacterium]|nr:FAD-binding oxidoreductase [Chromatiales bacterium]